LSFAKAIILDFETNKTICQIDGAVFCQFVIFKLKWIDNSREMIEFININKIFYPHNEEMIDGVT
jgi:hypothetical protein